MQLQQSDVNTIKWLRGFGKFFVGSGVLVLIFSAVYLLALPVLGPLALGSIIGGLLLQAAALGLDLLIDIRGRLGGEPLATAGTTNAPQAPKLKVAPYDPTHIVMIIGGIIALALIINVASHFMK